MDVSDLTGETAGKIYRLLESHPEKSLRLSEIKKQVNDKNTDYAIGWLLREGNIRVHRVGRCKHVTLNNI